MGIDISRLIAVINPEVFCEPAARKVVRKELRRSLAQQDRLAYLKTARLAVPREANVLALESLESSNPFALPGQQSPIEEHTLTFDHVDEPLEPFYFQLLDELQSRDGWVMEKVVDTLGTTAGADLGGDLVRRLSVQHQEISRLMVQIHRQTREVLRHWQVWRDNKRRLSLYEEARAQDGEGKGSALHQLRSRWRREQPDIAMDSPETGAFASWLVTSEEELRRQLDIDRRLLASELNLLRLQSDWVRPYLQARQERHQRTDPALVSTFNTAMFDVVLLVAPLSDLEQAVQVGELPDVLLKPVYRRSWPLVVIQFRFRAIPERSGSRGGGGYGFRGRAEIRFTSYALNQEELVVFRREIQRSAWGDVLGLLEQNTASDLSELLNDLDELLAEGEPKVPPSSPPGPNNEDTNPFSVLLSFLELFAPTPAARDADPVTFPEPLHPDGEIERVIRSFALLEARRWCRDIYDQQKRTWHLPVLGE